MIQTLRGVGAGSVAEEEIAFVRRGVRAVNRPGSGSGRGWSDLLSRELETPANRPGSAAVRHGWTWRCRRRAEEAVREIHLALHSVGKLNRKAVVGERLDFLNSMHGLPQRFDLEPSQPTVPMARAMSSFVAPSASIDRASRSIETEGSPPSILATRD